MRSPRAVVKVFGRRPASRAACPQSHGKVGPRWSDPSAFCRCSTARGRLDGLEVQPVDRAQTYERFDLGADFRVEGFFEAPFWAASREAAWGASSWASAHCSQASQ